MSISASPYSLPIYVPLQERFLWARDASVYQNIKASEHQSEDADQDDDVNQQGDYSTYDYDPFTYNAYTQKISNIEDLIHSYDFVGAAEEILKLNIGDIPQNLFDRFTEALENIVENLSLKETYLNAQLASQSLIVFAVQEELHVAGISLEGDEPGGFQSMNALGLDAISLNADDAAPFMHFEYVDEGIGMADEHNPQLSPDTSVVSRFMTQKSLQEHRSASLSNGGTFGQSIYSLELRVPF